MAQPSLTHAIQSVEKEVCFRIFQRGRSGVTVTERGEEVRETVTPIGWVDGRLWLYLGQMALEEADHVMWNGLTFRVRSCRPYYIGDRLSHYWAALELEREAAECGS